MHSRALHKTQTNTTRSVGIALGIRQALTKAAANN